MKIVSQTELRVATTWGAVVLFEAGVEREISEEIGLLAIQMGAKEVGKTSGQDIKVELEDSIESDSDPLFEIMLNLIEEGDPDNFKVDGTPKAAVINKLAKRTVKTDEREKVWQEALNAG